LSRRGTEWTGVKWLPTGEADETVVGMPTRLMHVCVDANDPAALARFWAEALGWTITYEDADEVVVAPGEDTGPDAEGAVPLVFLPVPEPKTGKNRVHIDLASHSEEEQATVVKRLEGLGATPVDIGQGDVPWTVLADPEGNELCVLSPREIYADTGPVAAIVVDCDDPDALAEFWTTAAGWPIVQRFEDGDVALRSPSDDGPFLELLRVPDRKIVKNRLHIDVAPFPDDDHAAEVERLRALGARPADIGQGDVRWVVLADPEGNELCVLTPR
jgi:predicted enzyme related to lactoylglutathione lyase